MQSSTPPAPGSERFLLYQIGSRPRYLDPIQNRGRIKRQHTIDLSVREASCKEEIFLLFSFLFWLSRVSHRTLETPKIRSASGCPYFPRFHIRSLSRMRKVFLKRTV